MILASITYRLYTPGRAQRYHSPLRLHIPSSRLLRYIDKKACSNFLSPSQWCSKNGRKFGYKLIHILHTYCDHKLAINQNNQNLMKDIS